MPKNRSACRIRSLWEAQAQVLQPLGLRTAQVAICVIPKLLTSMRDSAYEETHQHK